MAFVDPPVSRRTGESQSELTRALSSLRVWIAGVGFFSGVINLLALTGSIFMLQVYDRVLASRSVPTLVALAAIAAVLYALQGVLDVIRSRLLVRMGSRVDEMLGAQTYRAVLQLPLRSTRQGDGLQPIRDLDTIRSFLASQGPPALLDLPWIPIYLGFVFIMHAWLGWLATAGAAFLVVLTIATEILSRRPAREAAIAAVRRQTLSMAGRRNAEVLRAMGFGDRLTERWLDASRRHLAAHVRSGDVTGGLSAISKVFRAILQSAMLALGAWLTIRGEVSGGAIIASSIVSSRALAPIDLAIANWKPFLAARESRRRLTELLGRSLGPVTPLALPAPREHLSIEGVFIGAPGSGKPIVTSTTFKLEAGQALGIIGRSAAGKSTLARAVVGAWPLLRGSIRLDGAAFEQWSLNELGRHIGYLPQDIELFDGTISENIARFEANPNATTVIAAARAADIHEMILRLPDGYETEIGEDGAVLSAGQRQRVALARALYGDPFLVVLDEPNSNLDADGETALTGAIRGVRERGGIVIVVAHRPSAIAAVDLLAVMANGAIQAFGPKEEVLRKMVRPDGTGPAGLTLVTDPTT